MTRNTLMRIHTHMHTYANTRRYKEKEREWKRERKRESESESERKILYELTRGCVTFTDAGVDRANRPHYARALKTFLVLYGTCMTRLFIRKSVYFLWIKKKHTIARRRALRHPHEAFIYAPSPAFLAVVDHWSKIRMEIEKDLIRARCYSSTLSRPPAYF